MYNDIDFKELDRPETPISMRLNSTAIDIQHEGDAKDSDHVYITYYQDGNVKRIISRLLNEKDNNKEKISFYYF